MKEITNELTGIREVVLDSITEADMSGLKLPVVAVYKHPDDFPDKYVARIFDADRPTNTIMIKDSLIELKKDIEKTGMVFLLRGAEDVPALVGAYM
ncbi:MAG: hypothetical protein MJ117_04340 [Lachnospiraceae bacterium]|nr:hypothetical protein [Lachnospiraceae bacterium]